MFKNVLHVEMFALDLKLLQEQTLVERVHPDNGKKRQRQ